MASCQCVYLFLRSRSMASVTDTGTLIPYLCDVLDVLSFTPDTIISHVRRYCYTHQQNAGSWSIPTTLANSAVWIGYLSFITFNGTQDSDPSFLDTCNFHCSNVFLILLVPFLVIILILSFDITLSSVSNQGSYLRLNGFVNHLLLIRLFQYRYSIIINRISIYNIWDF